MGPTGYGGGQEDDDSQRSSLMLDGNGRTETLSSSEAGEESWERDEDCTINRRIDVSQNPESTPNRPSQPCMGISASTLSQNACKTFIATSD